MEGYSTKHLASTAQNCQGRWKHGKSENIALTEGTKDTWQLNEMGCHGWDSGAEKWH